MRRLGAAQDERLSRTRYQATRVGTVGSSTAKSGVIYYLPKSAWAVTGTGETTMGGWAGKVEKGSSRHCESPVGVVVANKTWHLQLVC